MQSTIYDVAKAAGVSSTMASRVLRGQRKTRDEATARILDAAGRLGYQRNKMASALRTRSSGLIGLLVPDLGSPFFTAFAEELSRQTLQRDFVVMSMVVDGENGSAVARRLNDYRVQAVVSAVPDIHAVLNQAGWEGTVVAVCRRPLPEPTLYVGMDDYRAGQLAGEYLLGLGHERVMAFLESPGIPSTLPRLAGIEEAFLGKGAVHFIPASRLDDLTPDVVADLHRRFAVSAVVGGSDAIAVRLYNAFARRHKMIPEELSLLAIDGSLPDLFLPVELTAVVQPIKDCVRKVLDWFTRDGPGADMESCLLAPTLRVGATTRQVLRTR